MKIALRLGATTVDTLNGTPGTFVQEKPSNAVVIFATKDCYISMLGEASAQDFFLKAETYFVAHLDDGEELSYVKATDDGTIRLTRAD